MNNLPAVLQSEIWEYVQGDRMFWKACHKRVINEIQVRASRAERFGGTKWRGRDLICWVIGPKREFEHKGHLHLIGGGLMDWNALIKTKRVWRRANIKNPKFHAEDLSFLINHERTTNRSSK